MANVFATMDTKQLLNNKTVSEIQKKIKDVDDEDQYIALPKTLKWQKSNGSFVTGTYTSHDENGFIINGRKNGYSFRDFRPGVKAYCDSLIGKKSPTPSATTAPPTADTNEQSSSETSQEATYKIEDWTNAKGKNVRASFVSLTSGQVTLKNEKGKLFTFPMNQLSKKSQMRVIQLNK